MISTTNAILLISKIFSCLPLTPPRPIVNIKVEFDSGRVVEKSEYLDIFMMSSSITTEGSKMPLLLILHRVHSKAKVAASTTRQCSSASYTRPAARSTYSTVRPVFPAFLGPKVVQLKWPARQEIGQDALLWLSCSCYAEKRCKMRSPGLNLQQLDRFLFIKST